MSLDFCAECTEDVAALCVANESKNVMPAGNRVNEIYFLLAMKKRCAKTAIKMRMEAGNISAFGAI